MRTPADPWGSDEPPLIADEDLPELPDRIGCLTSLTGPVLLSELGEDLESWAAPMAGDLPEVQLLRRDGWVLAPEESFLAFLPAVWPSSHRGWVRNRVPSVWLRTFPRPLVVLPFTAKDLWMEEQAQEEYPFNLEGTGIAVPSVLGRIWLLRSPVEGTSVEQFVERIVERAHHRAGDDGCSDPWEDKRCFVAAAIDVLSAT